MSNVVRFDSFEVDLDAGQLRRRGIAIKLRDQCFKVLACLLEHPGRLVTREELRRRLWHENVFVDFDNNLNIVVRRLRQALNDCADRARYIETLPKRGYRFVAAVSTPAQTSSMQPVLTRVARLLVLPFANMTGDPAQEYFSDAMTDEIITALVPLAPERLAVIARTTSMRYKGAHKDVARIGRELNVDYVVEGGVRRTEDHVVMNVQLIRAGDQTHLSAKRYEAAWRDVFDLQSAIALDIVRRLPETSGSLSASGDDSGRRKPTADPVAYQLYLQGRTELYNESPEGMVRAKQHLEQAITRDPKFALAYDGLGEFYWWSGFVGAARPRDACNAGIWAALRAIELDSSLAETHALLGQYRQRFEYNWPEAKRELDCAKGLNPASPLVRLRYAVSWLLPHGLLAEACDELQRALEVDPLSSLTRSWLAVMLWLARDYHRALDQVSSVVSSSPGNYMPLYILGHIQRELRNFPESIAAHQRSVEILGEAPVVLGPLGLALAQSGNADEARAILHKLSAIASKTYVPATSLAWIHVGLGEIDDAFVWLDRAIEERDPMIIPIKSYPFLDALRSDPRFQTLLRKMNLDAATAGTKERLDLN